MELKTLEEILGTHREDRQPKRTQTEIARLLKDQFGDEISVSQPSISQMEKGDVAFKMLFRYPQHRLAALRTYQLTDTQIRKLNDRFNLDLQVVMLPEGAQRVTLDGPKVRHFGPVNAGLSLTELSKEEVELLSVPDWIADRYDLDQVFSMDIVGNSMACEDVHKSIPEGSRVYFLEGVQPNPGETVCARLFDENLHVIKIYKPQQGYAILESYNHEHQPIIVNEDRPGDVVGVYLTHIPRGPRLR